MSRPPFIKPEKNVFVTASISETIKDNIRSIVNSGEYGKLEKLLTDTPVKLTFLEAGLNISLLHGVIQSTLTKTQKINICKLLIKNGIAVDVLDEKGLAPLYYAIKDQNFELVRLLIDSHAKLNKKFDYFQLALQPNIGECKSQLFNVQDQAMMSKYYSQQMNLERDLKIKINEMPFNLEIIRYLIEFITNLPNEKLSYIDLEANPIEIKKERNIKLVNADYIPDFENKLYYSLENITKDIYDNLRIGAINQDQIISKKTELTLKIRDELKTILNTRLLNTIPSLRNEFIYNPIDLANLENPVNVANIDVNLETIYLAFILRGNYSPVNLFGDLYNKYGTIQQNIINDINTIPNLITALLNIQPIIGNPGNQINLNLLLAAINGTIIGANLNLFDFNANDSKLQIISKFYLFIRGCNELLLQIFILNDFQILIDQNFNVGNHPNRNRQLSIIDDLRNIYYGRSQLIQNSRVLNEFFMEVNNITESELLYKKYIQPPNNIDYLLFNDNFLLSQYPLDLQNINNVGDINTYLNNLAIFSEKQLSYYDNPNNPAGFNLQYYLVQNPIPAPFPGFNINNSANAIPPLDDFPKPQPPYLQEPTYPAILLPGNNVEIINLRIIASIYHEHVFKSLLNPGNRTYYTIRDNFQQENPDIQIDQINKLMLTTLDAAIKRNFEELIKLTLTVTAGILVNNKLLQNPPADLTDQNIKKILGQKLKLIDIERDNRQQEFYLDENYTSSEPIDIIPCINNSRKILELLKKKMHVDPKQYQDLIFKLGNSNILKDLNSRNKITKNELNLYLSRHTQKYKDSLDFLNKQLFDDINAKQIDFMTKNIQNNYLINNGDFDNNINTLKLDITPRRNVTFKNIYKDLVNKQTECNEYLTNIIRIKLNILFEDIILPQVKEFLQFFADNNLDAIIDYANIQNELEPIIDNIIYYHMNIDPTKSKETQIPLESSVESFSNLFILPLDEETKIKLTTVYNERLKTKIIDLLSIICKYYGCVYRNFLKFIFNDTRYRKLDNVLI
jgi:hypothetical protein